MIRGWVLVAILSVMLTACSSPLNIKSLADSNPDKVLTINKLSGDRAGLFLGSLSGFCDEIPLQEVYRVQIVGANETTTKVFSAGGDLLCQLDTSDPEFAEKSVAILVNDEPIPLSKVQEAVNSLPQEARNENLGSVVNNIINQVILLQEAKKRGIELSDDDIAAAVANTVQQNNLNPTQQEMENLRSAVVDQLLVQTLIDSELQEISSEVSDQEALAYFDENKESLILPESWTIRHIQISIGDRGFEVSLEKARTVLGLLGTAEFCDLVTQFSDDTDSINNCGRYTFTLGQMNPNIANAVKEMQPDEARLVTTENSHHIIHLISANEARQATFDEVRAAIINTLSSQKRQTALQDFIDELREDSKIVSYLG